jgi:hypothetical protein
MRPKTPEWLRRLPSATLEVVLRAGDDAEGRACARTKAAWEAIERWRAKHPKRPEGRRGEPTIPLKPTARVRHRALPLLRKQISLRQAHPAEWAKSGGSHEAFVADLKKRLLDALTVALASHDPADVARLQAEIAALGAEE